MLNPDYLLEKQPLRFEDAMWNVAAFCSHDYMVFNFIDVLKNDLGLENINITVHGCPPARWNSGRWVLPLSKQEIEKRIKLFQSNNIPIYLTFSNCHIDKQALQDKESNYLLDRIAETNDGGVIVCEDILSDYIRNKYPHLKQISSVIRTVVHGQPDNASWYEKNAENFDLVVLAPDDSYNFPLQQQLIHKDKFEVMVNEVCIRNCVYRRRHYIFDATYAVRDVNWNEKNDIFSQKCGVYPDTSALFQIGIGMKNADRRTSCALANDEFQQVYDLGFRHIKLQGRADKTVNFLYSLCRYIIADEQIRRLVFNELCRYLF